MRYLKIAAIAALTVLFCACCLVSCNVAIRLSRLNEPEPKSYWQVKFDPADAVPGTMYTEESLGSHNIIIAKPEFDDSMQQLLNNDGIACVEVAYKRNDSKQEPLYDGEPELSAVFYFYLKADEQRDVEVSWHSSDGEQAMAYGTHLVRPGYVLKFCVSCSADDPTRVERMAIEDFEGNVSEVPDVSNLTFSENSLILPSKALLNGIKM